jgi:hypothetical protein
MVALRIAGWVLLGICVAAALAFVIAFPVMLLWNAVLPTITKGAVTELSYLQAVGLYLLCHILFKNHVERHSHDAQGRRQPRPFAKTIKRFLGERPSADAAPEAES